MPQRIMQIEQKLLSSSLVAKREGLLNMAEELVKLADRVVREVTDVGYQRICFDLSDLRKCLDAIILGTLGNVKRLRILAELLHWTLYDIRRVNQILAS